MYSPGSIAGMRQGKVSRAQAVKCPENTQGIPQGVTTFHPDETCDFPFSMRLDKTCAHGNTSFRLISSNISLVHFILFLLYTINSRLVCIFRQDRLKFQSSRAGRMEIRISSRIQLFVIFCYSSLNCNYTLVLSDNPFAIIYSYKIFNCKTYLRGFLVGLAVLVNLQVGGNFRGKISTVVLSEINELFGTS